VWGTRCGAFRRRGGCGVGGGVAARQPDAAEELVGPAVKIAYKDGVPGPAAMAFAKKAGVDVGALKTVTTPKGEYLRRPR